VRGCGNVAFVLLCMLALPVMAQGERDVDETRMLRQRYEQVLAARPERGAAFERMYQSYVEAEGAEAWIDQLRAQSEARPTEAVWPLLLGYVHERRGENDKALASYAEASRRDEKACRVWAARGRLLRQLGRIDEAVNVLRAGLGFDPQGALYREMAVALGQSLAVTGHADEAAAAWLAIAERFGDDPVAIEEVAELLADEGRTAEAIGQYEKLSRMASDDYTKVRAAYAAADLYVELKRYDEALAILKGRFELLAPGNWLRAEALRRIERVLEATDRGEAIEAFYRDWLSGHDDDVEMRMALAAHLSQGGNFPGATTELTKVIERSPTNEQARKELAELQLEQGRYDDAAGIYRGLCERNPGDARLWERLGRICLNDI